MSLWTVAAASRAVPPRRSVQRASPVAGREEADQVERVEQTAGDLAERDSLFAERGSLLGIELRQLGLEAPVHAARSVLERQERLGRQRLSSAGRSPGQSGQRGPRRWARRRSRSSTSARSRGSPDFACFWTRSSRRLDVVAVGHEQLEAERLEVGLGIRVG